MANENQEAKVKLQVKLTTMGILGADVDKTAQQISDSIPENLNEQFPGDVYERALAFFPQWQAAMGGNATGADPAEKTPLVGGGVSKATVLSAADRERLAAFEQSTATIRKTRQKNTKMIKILTDRPAPSEIIPKDAKMRITTKQQKWEDYLKDLVDTPENRANYEEGLKLIQGEAPVDIYIAEKFTPKTIGCVVSTPGPESGKSQLIQKTLTNKELLAFISTQLYGKIYCGIGELGCYLALAKQKKKGTASAGEEIKVPVVKYVNKKDAYGNEEMCQCTSQIVMHGKKPELHEALVRSKLSIKVYGKPNSAGVRPERTVRLSGRAQVHQLERVNPDFERRFGSMLGRGGAVTEGSDEDRAKLREALQITLKSLESGDSTTYGADLASFQDAMSKIKTNAPDAVDGVDLD